MAHLLPYRLVVSEGKEDSRVGEEEVIEGPNGDHDSRGAPKPMEVTLPDGRSATYEVIGSGSEPLLSFVGGPGLSAKLMRSDAQLFAERFTCYLIDPHGSGGSTPPRESAGHST